MVVKLDSVQPVFSVPLLEDIPDTEEDAPVEGISLSSIGPLALPEIVFGAATFSNYYNSEDLLASDVPIRTVRLALRYGIRAFDTSAYYGPSEIVLGTALKELEPLFPRSSYQLMTKVGRYGLLQSEFDYSPATIRKSIERSLERLHTTYLDTVYVHDVEFVCTPVGPIAPAKPEEILADKEKSAEYGLAPGQEGKIWGEGDEKVLAAVAELRKLQAEGKIKHVGISAYPLPTLLRIATLVQHTTSKPLDVLLSYCHISLQNSAFATYAPAFRERAKVGQLLTASPLNMGLLTPKPPSWHPASPELKEAAQKAAKLCEDEQWPGGLPNLAVGFAYRKGAELDMPVVVGLSNPEEVHESVRAWRAVKANLAVGIGCRKGAELNAVKEGKDKARRVVLEDKVSRLFGDGLGWSWASPPPELQK